MRKSLTVVLLFLLVFLAGCRTPPLLTPPPLTGEFPEIETGYYTVHEVREGRVAEEPFPSRIGLRLFLAAQEYVETSPSGRVVARYAGIRGVFFRGGDITSELTDGEVVHWWSAGLVRRGQLWLGPGDPGQGVALTVRFDADPKSSRVSLKFQGRTLGPERDPTVYLAHRGTCYYPKNGINREGIYPSNTMPAFEAALVAGYDGFELDVRVTKDGRFVVSHDESLGAATKATGNVSEKTLEELRDVVVTGSPRIPEVKVTTVNARIAAPMPSLREALETYLPDERVRCIVVDVKPDEDERIVAAATRAVEGFGEEEIGKILFITRSMDVIRALRPIAPGALYGLEGSTGREALGDHATYLPETAGGQHGPHDVLSVNLRLLLVFPKVVEGIRQYVDLQTVAHSHGYKVIAWTVNDARRFRLLSAQRVFPDFALSDAPFSRLAYSALEVLAKEARVQAD